MLSKRRGNKFPYQSYACDPYDIYYEDIYKDEKVSQNIKHKDSKECIDAINDFKSKYENLKKSYRLLKSLSEAHTWSCIQGQIRFYMPVNPINQEVVNELLGLGFYCKFSRGDRLILFVSDEYNTPLYKKLAEDKDNGLEYIDSNKHEKILVGMML